MGTWKAGTRKATGTQKHYYMEKCLIIGNEHCRIIMYSIETDHKPVTEAPEEIQVPSITVFGPKPFEDFHGRLRGKYQQQQCHP